MKHIEEVGRDLIASARRETPGDEREVPGPTPNPASNLLMADIAMRAGSYVLNSAIQKGFLAGRYGHHHASKMVDNRSLKTSLIGIAAAKIATRSLPGAVFVGGSMLAKTLYDRRRSRRARVRGDIELLHDADI